MKNCTKSIEYQVLYQTQNCFAICHSVNAQTGRVQGKIIPKFKITTKKVQTETGLTYHPLNQQATQNRLERILSNCFYKSAIIYINLQEQTQLYQTVSSTISFSIRECYIANFIKYYDSTTLFYQSGTVSETLLARIQANDHGVNLNNEKFVLHCSKVVKTSNQLNLDRLPTRQPFITTIMDFLVEYDKESNPKKDSIEQQQKYLEENNYEAIRKTMTNYYRYFGGIRRSQKVKIIGVSIA
ncbi:hypothetical protein SS50377_21681 [Spironucleus salmonicida]|uniref:Uncharacterized protein n=1 Tax=Spironucleus salmonicida TaxID=348837 RepID=V6LNQ5_9EUKA|nr:hypothetical protein SS50377_21681 [Spironucleus salmonicida]|eukprot:EST42369.1 Hypothetical protein SS50377_18103 [Spironucleus salmonicida]